MGTWRAGAFENDDGASDWAMELQESSSAAPVKRTLTRVVKAKAGTEIDLDDALEALAAAAVADGNAHRRPGGRGARVRGAAPARLDVEQTRITDRGVRATSPASASCASSTSAAPAKSPMIRARAPGWVLQHAHPERLERVRRTLYCSNA